MAETRRILLVEDDPRVAAMIADMLEEADYAVDGPYGTLADVRGLQGEENIARLALEARSGDAGGPILDRDGRVLGMLLPRANGARELPEDVAFAVESKVIAELAQKAGVTVDTTASSTTIKPQDLREKAKGMTVLVSCWE